ncbi:hypothetical protein TNCV_1907541 [Trichonephila clavipes]|nr:hypothetical protein TNCV_1907541 [Trichonephila clavipes]
MELSTVPRREGYYGPKSSHWCSVEVWGIKYQIKCRFHLLDQKNPESPELANMIAKLPKWSPKMTPTWLYRQDFVKFQLNHHSNAENASAFDGLLMLLSSSSSIFIVRSRLQKSQSSHHLVFEIHSLRHFEFEAIAVHNSTKEHVYTPSHGNKLT